MKAVIIGCGSIGGHIAYCLYESGFDVIVIAKGKTYDSVTKNGLSVQINQNKKIVRKKTLKINSRFKVLKSFKYLKDKKVNFIFITVKLKDYNQQLINNITNFADQNTAIIPPSTHIPQWWLTKFFQKKIKKKDNYFNNKNIIGMTMWVSSAKLQPNKILVRHTQRGYPIKAIDNKMKRKEIILRKAFMSKSKSPYVKNIYSEIYIKSLNALAFNMTALYFYQNNNSLKKNFEAISMIKRIMIEGEEIMSSLNLKHFQSYQDRINQTLSSSIHTMTMLSDHKKGKQIELKYLWKTFDILSKLAKIKMKYTESIYKKLIHNRKIK